MPFKKQLTCLECDKKCIITNDQFLSPHHRQQNRTYLYAIIKHKIQNVLPKHAVNQKKKKNQHTSANPTLAH